MVLPLPPLTGLLGVGLVSKLKEKLADGLPRLPAASATLALMVYEPLLARAVGVNDQVLVVLLTLALPNRVEPLKMRRVSPVPRAAEIVPEKVGVLSSVMAAAARLP